MPLSYALPALSYTILSQVFLPLQNPSQLGLPRTLSRRHNLSNTFIPTQFPNSQSPKPGNSGRRYSGSYQRTRRHLGMTSKSLSMFARRYFVNSYITSTVDPGHCWWSLSQRCLFH